MKSRSVRDLPKSILWHNQAWNPGGPKIQTRLCISPRDTERARKEIRSAMLGPPLAAGPLVMLLQLIHYRWINSSRPEAMQLAH